MEGEKCKVYQFSSGSMEFIHDLMSERSGARESSTKKARWS